MIVDTILSQMSSIKMPQRKFMTALLAALMYLPTRLNLRNLSRYLQMSERTLSRWFSTPFDFVTFNQFALEKVAQSGHELIAVLDACFMRKSGKETYGLSWFWDGSAGKAEKGLELSELGIIDVTHNTAYHLSAIQTKASNHDADSTNTRIDQYLAQLLQHIDHLKSFNIKHIVFDSFYSKIKMIHGVVEAGLDCVGKLRRDSSLRYLYQGEQKARGRPKKYDGKVDFNDLKQLELVMENANQKIYTAIVNSPAFERNIRIVYVLKTEGKKTASALLFSTDLSLDALTIVRYYKARFQIEFLFRDAKQFTGLNDHQVRDEKRLDFHINLSLTALNLLRLQSYQCQSDWLSRERKAISIASKKVKNFNEHLLKKISSMFAIDLSEHKYQSLIVPLCNYGVIAT